MLTILDTNVVISLLAPDHIHHSWSLEQFTIFRMRGTVGITDMIYCELSIGVDSKETLDQAVESLALDRVPCNDNALFRAAVAYKFYKANGGPKPNLTPDLLIGATAASLGVPLITANPRDFARYFPELHIIQPVPV